MKEYLSFNKSLFYLLEILVFLILTFFQQELDLEYKLNNDDILAKIGKDTFLDAYNKYRWIAFALVPLFVIIRVMYSATCLYVGNVFSDSSVEYGKIRNFTEYFNVALKSEIILFAHVFTVFTLSSWLGIENGKEIMQYTSLAALFDVDIMENWIMVFFTAMNIFELAYWFFMAKLLSQVHECSYWRSFKFVLTAYVPGFLIYIVAVMFLLLYLS
ncbi:MAG: hypothetical protein LBP85_06745 [Prevotellaceae bacterium]|jgi:hypothetical protein|nr:hypothetical protein [Prevotellaceae bacterium]